MKDYSIDAIKIAKAIQNDKLDFLHGKEFKMRDRIKKRKRMKKTRENENKYTLAQIGENLAKLNQKVDDGFKQVNTRIDRIESRIDRIEARLDYNGLKDLPKR
ncbi:MAG: hypothetical protein MJ208_03110 [Bacilli bacterium]|nr:hypothetical protein [Bacilli bacterium]